MAAKFFKGGIAEIATGETRWLQNSFGILQEF